MAGLQHLWYGYLLIQLSGFSPERFLNLCSANGIEIWDLRHGPGGYEFFMTVRGYRSIRPLVQKSRVRLKIKSRHGLPFFLYQNRKRKLFAAGFFGFFICLYLMSLFIWDIQLEGNVRYTDNTVLKFLKSHEVIHGMYKYGLQCDDIEEKLRSEFPEITWVSARISGTRLLIQVKENQVLSSIPGKEAAPRDLVASKDGVITAMVVRAGVPVVSVGETVERGQMLVKGTLEITNDSEEVVSTHLVAADGDIFASTKRSYVKTYPKYRQVKADTGKKKNGIFLRLGNQSMVALIPPRTGTSWKFVKEEVQLKLFENFYLPVYWGKIRGKEYVAYEKSYTKEEQEKLAAEYHRWFTEKLAEKGVQIIENSVKILESEKMWQVNGRFRTVEAIGEARSLSESELEETKAADEYY